MTQPLSAGMTGPEPYGDPDFSAAVHQLNGHPFTMTHISMGAHTGTHVDAPRHFLADGRTIDAYPADTFSGPAVILDLRREGPVAVTAADLAEAEPAIRDGDIVFLCFGYGRRFGTNEYAESHPFLTEDAAAYLVGRGVPLVGVDLPTPDRPQAFRGRAFDFPVHRILLSSDCLIVENLGAALEDVAGQRADVLAAPLLIEGADGAPARVLVVPRR